MNLGYYSQQNPTVVQENEHAVKTRVPGTWGENARFVWLNKENVMDIHNGKTMLTFIDNIRIISCMMEQNRVVETKRGG